MENLIMTYKQANNVNKSSRSRDLRSRPCLGPGWWRPCCCARTESPRRSPGTPLAASGTSRSPAPRRSCRTLHTPAGLASLPWPPGACSGPAWSASIGAPAPASTLRRCYRSLAAEVPGQQLGLSHGQRPALSTSGHFLCLYKRRVNVLHWIQSHL